MAEAEELMEKYFIGFDFRDKEKPNLLVGKHNGRFVEAVNYISDKALVEELHIKLTGKEPK